MNRIFYKSLFIICLGFATSNLRAQTCDFIAPSTVCSGQPVTFYSQCQLLRKSINWYVDGILRDKDLQFIYSFPNAGSFDVTAVVSYTTIYDDPEQGITYIVDSISTTKTVAVLPAPGQPVIQGAASFCDVANVSLSIANPDNVQYQWASVPSGFTATGANITFANVTQNTTFSASVTNTNGCTSTAFANVTVVKTTIVPTLDPQIYYHKKVIIAQGNNSGSYWETSADGTDLSNPVNGNYTVTEEDIYYVRTYNSSANCWTNPSSPVQVALSFEPPMAVVTQIRHLGYNEIFYTDSNKDHILKFANYFWVSDAGTNPTIISQYINGGSIKESKVFDKGLHYLRGQDVGTGTWGPTLTLDVDLRGDDELNWVSTQTFDGTIVNGKETVASSSKSYFDDAGKPLQSQSINMTTGQVLATDAPIKDKYGRNAVATLPAPTNRKYLMYRPWFVKDAYSDIFDYHDFDVYQNYNLGSGTPGTVGWYYSDKNTLESNVAKSEYPYSRTQYYPDGVGGAMYGAGVGEILKKDEHKTLTGTFPVTKELDYYLTLRAVVPLTSPTTLANNAVQTVVRDENGQYAVSITDKSGKTVLTARNGNLAASDFILQINNVVMASSDETSSDYKQQFDFYILNAQRVSIAAANSTSPAYAVIDMFTNEPVIFDLAGTWPVGFYRLKLTSGDVTLSYSNYFQDVACQFYNDAGRLVSSLSPNGFQSIKYEIDNPRTPSRDLTTIYSEADKTTYQYNHRGWLLSMTEPDAGTTRYMYRKDGSIRYSQNAKQLALSGSPNNKHRFSYTNYDELGRPVESGEYTGSDYILDADYPTIDKVDELKNSLEVSDQINFTTTQDWVRTHYDVADPNFVSITGLSISAFTQNYTRNAVSWTENVNNKTWYSYNELGRVVWMVQKPTGLPRTFVVEYLYDFLGNVLQVKQSVFLNDGSASNGSLLSTFYHHYEYDADKRLLKAFTSLDGSNKTLHASYQYYLHGPLKRIELGGNLQGIDFVYNIHGWLESINHPDASKDPGHDGAPGSNFRSDVFGLLLDYYDSEFNNLFPVLALDKSKDLQRLHHLPGEMGETLQASSFKPERGDFFFPDQSPTDYFKNYSAQNSIYKELLKRLSQTTSNK